MTETFDHHWKPRYNPWLIALTVTLATFMEVLDTSIANVALPHIAGNLSAGVDESTWVLTSYLVANAVILPLSGWLSSLIGRKNYYMASVAVFTVSSMLCGLAPSLGWLLFFRILQGLGGGGLQPSEQAILADTFPHEKLGMALAVYGVAVVTAPILGPTLGGWITDNFNWRWIFLINIPFGLLSIFLTSRLVEDPPHLKRKTPGKLRIDFIGLGAITLGIAALQIVLDKGQREDWFDSSFIIATSAISLGSLVFAVFWELKEKDPIVDVRMLGERNFAFSCLLMFVLGLVLYGSTTLLPLFLQTLLGYNATTAGLVLSPGGIITMASMPLVGFLLSKVDARKLIAFGLSVVGLSLLYMSRFNLTIDFWTSMSARLLQSAGLGFIFIPINTAAYAFVPAHKRNQASGLINFARNIGAGVGIAMVSTLLARQAQVHQTVLSAHTSELNPAFRIGQEQAARQLIEQGAASLSAHQAAPAMIYQQVLRQSSMLAYLDNFHLMALICFAALLLLFFLKKKAPSKGPIEVH